MRGFSVIVVIITYLLLLASCGEKKKHEEVVKKEEEKPSVPITVYRDAGPHPVTQQIKALLEKYPVQTFSIADNTASHPKRASLASKPINTLKITDYYLMYTAPDSSEVWCWNLRQYCVVMKIMTKDISTGATKQKGTATDADTTTSSSGTKTYHLYISLN
jgi:hypothetical protein